MAEHVLLSGPKRRSVVFWGPSDKTVERKFAGYSKKIPEGDFKRIVRTAKGYVSSGEFTGNKEKFKSLEGQNGLYEIKSYQIRLIGFFDGPKFVIVHCVRKKKDRHDPKDLATAQKLKGEYYAERS